MMGLPRTDTKEAGIFESRPEHLSIYIVDKVPLPNHGFVDIPNGPGLGMALLPDAQRIRPPLSNPFRCGRILTAS
jgi:hypothetical protein